MRESPQGNEGVNIQPKRRVVFVTVTVVQDGGRGEDVLAVNMRPSLYQTPQMTTLNSGFFDLIAYAASTVELMHVMAQTYLTS